MSSVGIHHNKSASTHVPNPRLYLITLLAVLHHHLSAAKIVFGMPLTHHTSSTKAARLHVMHRQDPIPPFGLGLFVYAFWYVLCHPIIRSIFRQGNGRGTRHSWKLCTTTSWEMTNVGRLGSVPQDCLLCTLTASQYNVCSLVIHFVK